MQNAPEILKYDITLSMLYNKESKLKDQVKNEVILVIDMLANVLDSEDKDAIEYAFIAYKYVAKTMPIRFMGRVNKINKLIKDIVNAI